MKTLLSLTVMAMAALISFHSPAKAEDMMKEPLRLVAFHSDTCGACKVLAPKVEAALQGIEAGKIETVKFDYTSKDTIMKSKEVAMSEGLDALQKEHGAKTGFAILVKSDGSPVETFTSSDSADDIKARLMTAVEQNS